MKQAMHLLGDRLPLASCCLSAAVLFFAVADESHAADLQARKRTRPVENRVSGPGLRRISRKVMPVNPIDIGSSPITGDAGRKVILIQNPHRSTQHASRVSALEVIFEKASALRERRAYAVIEAASSHKPQVVEWLPFWIPDNQFPRQWSLSSGWVFTRTGGAQMHGSFDSNLA